MITTTVVGERELYFNYKQLLNKKFDTLKVDKESNKEEIAKLKLLLKTKIDIHVLKKFVPETKLGRAKKITLFNFVLQVFFHKIAWKIIADCYTLDMGQLGKFFMQRKEVKPQIRKSDGTPMWKVDWPATRAYKKLLIEQGKEHLLSTKPEEGKICYIVPRINDIEPWFQWSRPFNAFTNSKYYRLRPTIGINGLDRKMRRFVKDNPDILNKYPLWEKPSK